MGALPGPKEPKHDVNSYLGLLVSELYTGVWFETSCGKQFIRSVLLCFSSDLPATRKAAGFVGHKSIKGCSRCLKHFQLTQKFGQTTLFIIEIFGHGELMNYIVIMLTKNCTKQRRK